MEEKDKNEGFPRPGGDNVAPGKNKYGGEIDFLLGFFGVFFWGGGLQFPR
jgi:hypothetical protein